MSCLGSFFTPMPGFLRDGEASPLRAMPQGVIHLSGADRTWPGRPTLPLKWGD